VLWIFSGITLLGEVSSTRRKTCLGTFLSTTNPTLIGLGLNPWTHISNPETNSMEHEIVSLLQCMHASTHFRTYVLCMCIYACTYMYMHALLHAVASAIVSSCAVFPLQAPFIKSSCTELRDVSDHKNT
jgi:hypothetical protein